MATTEEVTPTRNEIIAGSAIPKTGKKFSNNNVEVIISCTEK